MKKLFLFLAMLLVFSMSLVSSQGLVNPNIQNDVSFYTGNLTNLSELQDIQFSTLSNNEHIIYNAATGKWINSFIAQTPFMENSTTIYQINTGKDLDIDGGDVYANAYFGDGSQLSGILGSQITNNLNWLNQTSADGLYYSISNPYGFYNSTSIPTANSTAWNKSGTNVFLANTNDNVGIGTSSPGEKLSIRSSSPATLMIQSGSSAVGQQAQVSFGASALDLTDSLSGAKIIYNRTESGNTGGSLIFSTRTSSNIMAENMRISNNGNVGIGTTNPTRKLEVASSGAGTDVFAVTDSINNLLFKIRENGGAFSEVYMYDSSHIVKNLFSTAGDSYITGGNVGIGTTSPNAKLVVSDAGGTGLEFTPDDANNRANMVVFDRGDSLYKTFRILASDLVIKYGQAGADAMVVSNTGNVGIGTAVPQSLLHVLKSGTASAHSDSDFVVQDSTAAGSTAQMQILGGNAGNSFLYFSDTDSYSQGAIQYAHGTDAMNFRVNAATAMTIDSSRNVGVGTSSPQAGMKMDVRSDNVAGSSAITAYGYNGGGGMALRGYGYATSGTGDNTGVIGLSSGVRAYGTNIGGYFYASGAPTNYALITGAGNVGIGTTSPSTKLQVSGAHINNYGQFTINSTSEDYIYQSFYSGANFKGAVYYDIANNDFHINNHNDGSSGDLVLNIGGGNVGIGTSSPSQKLHVAGGSSDSTPLYVYRDNTNVAVGVQFATNSFSGRAIGMTGGGNYFIGATDGSKFTLMDSTGNVGIGTTSPTSKLHIEGGNVNMSNNNITNINTLLFNNGDSISGNNSILITVSGKSRLLLGETNSTFTGDVNNVDNIDDWSRFSETNLNNGTMAISGFTANNADMDSMRMGITSRGYDSGNPFLLGGQGGLNLDSNAEMGFSINYNRGFNWRNDPADSGLHENTTNVLMTLSESGDLNVSGSIYSSSHKVKARKTNNQTITNGEVWNNVTWNSEDFDIGNLHSTSTENQTITISKNGYYLVSYNIKIDSMDKMSYSSQVIKNGALLSTSSDIKVGSKDSSFIYLGNQGNMFYLNSGDKLVLQVSHDNGGTALLHGTSSYFSVVETI